MPKLEITLGNVINENKLLKEQVLLMRKQHLSDLASTLMGKVKKIGDTPIICAVVDVEKSELIELANDLIKRLQTGVVFLCLLEEKKCQLLLRVSPDLVAQGIHANELIQSISKIIEGSGGGKKESAQAGGTNPKGVIIAFDKIEEMLKNEKKP